jgi:serine/threonine-protein kinase
VEQDDLWLNGLADAILDGSAADLSGTSSETSDSRRAAIRQADILARIVRLHLSLSADSAAVGETASEEAAGQLTSWGRLTIIEEIGRGAFGAVYRARDPRLDREVALKLLRPHTGVDPDRLAESVIEEGRLLARVHHPNVVAIYDADRIAGRVGLTMEFVRGRTLEQILQERGPFSTSDVAAMGSEICRALGAVHQAGLLHRDIKAQNVMRQEAGGTGWRLVLMDFGAGRELDQQRGWVTDLAGTPLYLAPEIFQGHPATVQSDLYSVGVLLYHLLTRSYPVAGRTVRDIRDAQRRNQRESLRRVRADVPDALVRVIDRALEAHAADRYASADLMAAALAP